MTTRAVFGEQVFEHAGSILYSKYHFIDKYCFQLQALIFTEFLIDIPKEPLSAKHDMGLLYQLARFFWFENDNTLNI